MGSRENLRQGKAGPEDVVQRGLGREGQEAPGEQVPASSLSSPACYVFAPSPAWVSVTVTADARSPARSQSGKGLAAVTSPG